MVAKPLCPLYKNIIKPLDRARYPELRYTLDHHRWNSYNESINLELQIEKFYARFDHLPATIHTDKIYLNKVNWQYQKDEEIKSYCKPWGRPSKESKTPEFIAKITKAVGERNEIECSFGTSKRIYRANNIRVKLPEKTSAGL